MLCTIVHDFRILLCAQSVAQKCLDELSVATIEVSVCLVHDCASFQKTILWRASCSLCAVTVDPIRKILPYTGVLVILVALYTAYTFYARHTDADLISKQQTEKKLEADRDAIARMGGTSLKITSFYANPAVVVLGKSGELCYGAINATSLVLDPPVESISPSLGRCFSVAPKTTTHYILTARDAAGHSVEQVVDVMVR